MTVPDSLEQQVRRTRRQRRELQYGFMIVVGVLMALVLSLLLRSLSHASLPVDLIALVVGFAIAAGLQRVAERRHPTWFRRSDASGARPSA
jgi:cobalamin biosynthesis protein CobD/CbiB